MPALIGSVDDFQSSRIGQTMAPYFPSLPEALDHALLEASDDVLRYLDRKLLLPPTTALTDDLDTGVLQLPVLDAVNIFPEDVAVFPSTGEVAEIMDVSLSIETLPAGQSNYPGNLQLLTATVNPYSAGAVVQIYRQDRYRTADNSNASGMRYLGGAEGTGSGTYATVVGGRHVSVRLYEYPLWDLYAVFQTLPFVPTTEEPFDIANLALQRSERGYILGAGWDNPEGTIWRTLYRAGYAQSPMAVVQATYNLVAAELAKVMNPAGGMDFRSADVMVSLTRRSQVAGEPMPRSYFIEDAYRLLDGSNLRRRHGAY